MSDAEKAEILAKSSAGIQEQGAAQRKTEADRLRALAEEEKNTAPLVSISIEDKMEKPTLTEAQANEEVNAAKRSSNRPAEDVVAQEKRTDYDIKRD